MGTRNVNAISALPDSDGFRYQIYTNKISTNSTSRVMLASTCVGGRMPFGYSIGWKSA
ncbi:hypothetical protein ACFL2V_20770 [Pseudomonadota bacterium]